jgi:hypothetical protein
MLKYYDAEIVRKREGVLWMKFLLKEEAKAFSICICYMPPKGSIHELKADAYFESLLQDVYEYQHIGKVCICGDLNSHCGTQLTT